VLTISAPTVAELVAGLQRTGRIVRLGEITTALAAEVVLPFDQDAAIIAGQIHGELIRTGRTIGRIDPMIAGIVLHHDLTLVTGNTQHYERVIHLGYPLRLDNWRA
jgi:predicted nucleic acid-binding protein